MLAVLALALAGGCSSRARPLATTADPIRIGIHTVRAIRRVLRRNGGVIRAPEGSK